MKTKGSGPKQRLPVEIENLVAEFIEESWLNLTPKFKKQIIDEVNYYLVTARKLKSVGNVLVTYGWLDGLQERKEKTELIGINEAKNYSEKNCTDVIQWTAVRRRHLEHIQENFLPLNLKQVYVLDLIDLQSGADPKMTFQVLIAYIGIGKIFRMYLKDTHRFSEEDQELCRQNFGYIFERNGEIPGACLAVVVHDIER